MWKWDKLYLCSTAHYDKMARRSYYKEKRKEHNRKQEILNWYRNIYGSISKAKLAMGFNDE